jgi:DNA-binding response OmpR family regulator
MILIVEDDSQIGRLIALVLKRNGFASCIVADGEGALDRASTDRPEMVFADLTLQGMGGEAFCRALKSRSETKDIPCIVVSGDRDVAEKARLCGADDYLAKPFELGDLARLLDKYAHGQSRKAD